MTFKLVLEQEEVGLVFLVDPALDERAERRPVREILQELQSGSAAFLAVLVEEALLVEDVPWVGVLRQRLVLLGVNLAIRVIDTDLEMAQNAAKEEEKDHAKLSDFRFI